MHPCGLKFSSAKAELFIFMKSFLMKHRIITLPVFQAITNMSTSNHVLLTKVLCSLPAEQHYSFPLPSHKRVCSKFPSELF